MNFVGRAVGMPAQPTSNKKQALHFSAMPIFYAKT